MPNYDKLTPKEALQQWKAHCETVQEATTVDAHETDAQKKQRIKRLLSDYGAFVDYYFPHYTTNPQTGRQTPCAPFHLKAAKQIISDRNVKAVFKWHRGAAKSTHLDIFIPMWLKAQIYGGAELRQFWVMVLVGKSQDNANTLLADLQTVCRRLWRTVQQRHMGGGFFRHKRRYGLFRPWSWTVAPWSSLSLPPS